MQNYTLDNSKGSQTAIVPKSTYKELQTQPRLAKITAVLHLHNEYKTLKVLIKIPDKYKDYPLWWLNHDDVKRHYKWANHLPLPEDVFGIWKPKVTNRVEDDWNTYDINDNEYYYEINNVNIVRNKKYKAPPVEEKPRLRRRRTNKNDTLEPANDAGWSLDDAIADSNQKLEDLQEQEGISTNKLKELQKQIEEEEERRINILAKQIEFKKEIKGLKIKRAKQNNKNGYVILAQDDFAPKEQVYGYSQRFEEAQTIAEEAVKIGSRRLEKRPDIETDFKVGAKIEACWPKDNKWYGATIRKVHECKFDVKWTDGGQHTDGLELHQIRIKDYNKFNSARIVDLDTQMDIEYDMIVEDCW
jgi:hypothetical protein